MGGWSPADIFLCIWGRQSQPRMVFNSHKNMFLQFISLQRPKVSLKWNSKNCYKVVYRNRTVPRDL